LANIAISDNFRKELELTKQGSDKTHGTLIVNFEETDEIGNQISL
jgi:hypothetical protein